MKYISVLRPWNLLMVIIAQSLIHYAFFERLGIEIALDHGLFFLLTFATVMIMAGGNVINDILDLEIDQVNKPEKMIVGKKLSLKTAYNLYMALTSIGVLAGFILTRLLDKPALFIVFVLVAAVLYLYSSQLKGILLAGNVLVALMVSLSLLVVPLFDLFPVSDGRLEATAINASRVILHLAVFAFAINLLRELIKDILDVNGDHKAGMQTIPVLLGRKTAGTIAFVLSVGILVLILIYTNLFLYSSRYLLIYTTVLIIAPLLYICTRLWYAEQSSQYALIARLLKLIMLLGLGSIPLLGTIT